MKTYFENSDFTLYLADVLDALDELPPKSVDVIFADPPYNLSNGGITCRSGKMASVNKGSWDVSRGIKADYDFHKKWILKCRDVLKDDGTVWISGTYHSIYACGFALQTCGYQIINDICWYKPNAPPNLSTRYFTASHETLLWARKSCKSKHRFNYNLMKTSDWNEDQLKITGKQMRSVWSIPSPKPSEKRQGRHPTQKPIALLRRVILSSSDVGDVILDPFTGSSTTGLVAIALGRQFIGIDNNSGYLDLSIKRYNEMKG